MADRSGWPVEGRFLDKVVETPTSSAMLLAERVRKEIYLRRPAPGTHLFGLAELGKRAGCGPSVVREALQHLSADGLVEIRRGPKGGVYAREVGAEIVAKSLGTLVSVNAIPRRTLIEARLEIEALCARLAASHATERDLSRLRSSVERAKEIGADSARFAEENIVFHTAIAEATHNEIIIALTQSVRDVFFEETVTFDYRPEALREALRAHERLVELIAAGKEEEANRLMRVHVHEFNVYVLDSGQASPASGEPGGDRP
ncbi:FadR/GntR family transcriptional regulator [Actinomadura sp. 1N219]|uniref:FadR/GntR family transcriptional regulator n=1 Tax=Actinomadura sp. 1N219 TaxID=3375152 RepID=UPI0037B7DC29